jgi:hypothetical protein
MLKSYRSVEFANEIEHHGIRRAEPKQCQPPARLILVPSSSLVLRALSSWASCLSRHTNPLPPRHPCPSAEDLCSMLLQHISRARPAMTVEE